MKFNVSSKVLYSATSAVSKVINTKNTLAILDNFLINLTGNVLTITGSDQENASPHAWRWKRPRARVVYASVPVASLSSSRRYPTKASP